MAKPKAAERSEGRRAPARSPSRPRAGKAGGGLPGAEARAARKAAASVALRTRVPGAVSRAKTGAPDPESREDHTSRPSPAVPSSLNMSRRPSAARSGRAGMQERYREHPETGPGMTGGDIDADWESAYSVGDEAPGGDNPTPGQAIVEDVGRALGVEYEDGEELKAADKIESRDRHRWELDPASSEDYPERTRGGRKGRSRQAVKNAK
jgi:hypothetical protein